jgi:multiple antibiotic resistance protein
MEMPSNLTSAFVTLFVTIGPVETAAIFAGLTGSLSPPERLRLASRAVAIAGVVLFAFALGGASVLALLHVSLPAFRVAGGMLLFLQALTLTFASPGLSSISAGEQREARRAADMAVFPLAFPVIAGPGGLAAVVLVIEQSKGLVERGAVLGMLLACLLLTYLALLAADRLVRWLGETGADVVGRISGILLAALAVQFIFDGVREARLFP